ncbi:hypothetical protein AMTR_s00009p00162970 [Amborella trichopoda]|uniref:Uncharacterized protein n=1 Tax=Amborella trichopoda TaxID=13333 RepID=W1NGI2_AMBTC|nr:hypothetical protein AMTR_s00009p00162970 [Amborella trichopoda]
MVEAAEVMEEDDDDFNESIDEDDDNDDREMQDDWLEPTVIECEVSQGTRTSILEKEGLRLVHEEVERARHSNYTSRQRRTGRRCHRLISQDDYNDDEGQITSQGGENHEQCQSLGDYGLRTSQCSILIWQDGIVAVL